jgi:putative radical SAM enzyme (TIGR03279 family)
MTMLPTGMRPALYLRDDDYRLSFLQGNFVTLTNLSAADVRRIIRYHLSPLHVSLHAITPAVRKQLMGGNHARGIEVLERLLNAGIEVHAQVVLTPGINSGDELNATLAWVEERPNILSVGIVPYGFTRYARLQTSFTSSEARDLIEQMAPFQERSRERNGMTRFQLADEWYLLANVTPPPAEHYDGYPQFEDGIGMLRAFEDEWTTPQTTIRPQPQENTLFVTGEAFAPTLKRLITQRFAQSAQGPEVRAIRNNFFGGNVNVTGLLTAHDIISQLKKQGLPPQSTVFIPKVVFNADGLTLDDRTLHDISHALNCPTHLI